MTSDKILGLKHIVMCGGERNYVERWFETFKDRLRTFDCYSPTREFTSVRNFIAVFCFRYNSCRGDTFRSMVRRSEKKEVLGGGWAR